MKTLSLAVLLVANLAFVMMGCSDSPDSLVNPGNQPSFSPGPPDALMKTGVKHSLTGSAHTYNVLSVVEPFGNVILPGPKQKGGFYNVLTVNAIEHSDGSFSGNMVSQFMGKIPEDYTYEYVEFLGTVRLKVLQLQVDETGTIAKVVCEITSWDGPPLPWWFGMVFIDKGEGKSSGLRDECTSWWFSDQESYRDMWLDQTPEEFIDWQWDIIEPFFPDMRTIPIDNGNIQVR